MRRSTTSALIFCLAGASLAGCAGLSQMQDSLGKFDQGAHSVATTETSFLSNVQALDCETQYYRDTAKWALGNATTYDLTGACTPTLIRSDDLTIRQNLLNAITLYADKLQALASTAGNKTLDTNAQGLAKQLNGFAAAHGMSKGDGAIAGDVEAALIGIAEMALDQRRFNDAREAAKAMETPLEKVVGLLKQENDDLAQGVISKRGALETELRTIVATVPAQDPGERFFLVLQSREIYRNSNPFGAEAVATAGQAPSPDTTKLDAALDGLVSANQAIARTGTGGIVAAVSDLVARANAAQADQAAINK